MIEQIRVGQIVQSIKGRDKGSLYVVVGISDKGFLYLADGRARPMAKKKKKNFRHVQYCYDSSENLSAEVRQEKDFTDLKIRAAIKQFVATEA